MAVVFILISVRYVCKWCGHVTNTMTELNMHKADVHAMPPFTIRSDRDRMLRKRNIHGLIALGAHPKQNEIEDHHGSTITSNSSLNFRSTNPRTACEQCGLRLVRPSLLVRHMLRVHSKSTFSCEIEVPDTCNYRIDVDCERITWTCCDTQYTSRREFFFHRVNNHLNKITDNVTGNLCITHQDSSFPSGSLTSGVNICSGNSGSTLDYVCETTTELDGNMRFVVPQEVVGSDGEFFIVVESNSDDHGKDIGGAETSDNRMQKMNDGLQQPQIHSDLISSSSKSQEILVETVDQTTCPPLLHVVESLDQIVTITAEQYEQLQSQYGSSLDEMSVVYVDRDDASRDVLVGDIKETYECDPRALCN
ncbi:zinc finger, C2H2 type [Dictyocaulus viviparus]|uniref:Zinc finger, C2H2 type n=1 Tax=Dictyocaulus viviparus TaxID=29172 RepID=A0A0D8XLG9_DICVI|nr:zinc finger, C2H2 type [Dictyocaulus viviparus]